MKESGHKRYENAAVDFLRLAAGGRVEEGYEKYVDLKGKHHNFFFPAGFPTLKKAMMESDEQFPNKKLTVKNVICDGDLVVIHSHIILNPSEKGMAVVHILRFSGGRIVEMWDLGQAIPAEMPNHDGAF